jgi:AraC-like DNA-binding protein
LNRAHFKVEINVASHPTHKVLWRLRLKGNLIVALSHEDTEFFHRRETLHAVKNLTVTRTVFQPGEILPRHIHHDAYLAVTIKGNYQDIGHGFDDTFNAGDLVYHPKNETHENIIGLTGSVILNFFVEDAFWSEREIEDLQPSGRVILQDPKFLSLANALNAIIVNQNRRSSLEVEGVSIAIIGHFLECCNSLNTSTDQMHEINDYLYKNYCSNLSIESIAKKFESTPETLSRKFKQIFGESLHDRTLRLRLNEVERLLQESTLNLTEIALEVGFFDQSHFNRIFKKWKGISPGKYRKMLNADTH